jgi:putative transcriptional regulator
MRSLRARFLIATRSLRDPNFHRSVVLMLEHNDSGAMGLIVNHPSKGTVHDAISQHFDIPDNGDLLYVGGPVEANSLLLLHNAEDIGGDNSIVPGVFVGGSEEAFEEVARRASAGDTDLRYRVYSGYSGWGKRQLDGEVSRNDWLDLPATAEQVFGDDPYALWDDLVREYRATRPIVPLPPGARSDWN